MTDWLERYRPVFARALQPTAVLLERHVADIVSDLPHVDRVTARAKDPERFAEKAVRLTEEGQPKYKSPMSEIQDQLGARIVVFYLDDVDRVVEVVRRYFQPIEERELVPESHWEFGYFGQHFVLPVPGDVVPQDVDPGDVPRFFELQVKTLFQHAWSEAHHDLGYKPIKALSSDQQRRLAFTAAQAWGADRVFAELVRELSAPLNAVEG